MKITGIDGLSDAQIHAVVQQGATFVIYQYCISNHRYLQAAVGHSVHPARTERGHAGLGSR